MCIRDRCYVVVDQDTLVLCVQVLPVVWAEEGVVIYEQIAVRLHKWRVPGVLARDLAAELVESVGEYLGLEPPRLHGPVYLEHVVADGITELDARAELNDLHGCVTSSAASSRLMTESQLYSRVT